jgi:16S rRNA (uracil1498-N3)-methyltransferase
MKHEFRFWAARLADGVWELDAEELHHARKVLKLGRGEAIELTNGKGWWAEALFFWEDGRVVLRNLVERMEAAVSPPLAIAVGALASGEMDELLPPLVELGVDAIWVFRQEGGERARVNERSVARWERLLRAAVKQSKRAWAPELRVLEGLDETLRHAREIGYAVWTLDQEGSTRLGQVPWDNRGILAIVGSERGFTTSEEALLEREGVALAVLGRFVLRAKTAVVSAAAVLASSRPG